MLILRHLTPKEDQAVRDVLDGAKTCQQVHDEVDVVEWIRISQALQSCGLEIPKIS